MSERSAYGYRRAIAGMFVFWWLGLLMLVVNLIGLIVNVLGAVIGNPDTKVGYHVTNILEVFPRVAETTRDCWRLRKAPESV